MIPNTSTKLELLIALINLSPISPYIPEELLIPHIISTLCNRPMRFIQNTDQQSDQLVHKFIEEEKSDGE